MAQSNYDFSSLAQTGAKFSLSSLPGEDFQVSESFKHFFVKAASPFVDSNVLHSGTLKTVYGF